tara:strand:- start:15818 stop:16576 length:759 start_codon:yes stop_codon:yes gene_type:complete
MNLAEKILNEFKRSTTDDIQAARDTRNGNRARVNTRADQRYAARTQGKKDARRPTYLPRQQASTEIIKNGRMALAEMVLERLAEDETKVTKAYGTSKRANARAGFINRTAAVKKEGQARKRGDSPPEKTTTRNAKRIAALGHSNGAKYLPDGTPAPNPKARKAPEDLADPDKRTGPRGDIDNSAGAAAINRTQLISKLARGRGHKTPKVIGNRARAEAVRGSDRKIADTEHANNAMLHKLMTSKTGGETPKK